MSASNFIIRHSVSTFSLDVSLRLALTFLSSKSLNMWPCVQQGHNPPTEGDISCPRYVCWQSFCECLISVVILIPFSYLGLWKCMHSLFAWTAGWCYSNLMLLFCGFSLLLFFSSFSSSLCVDLLQPLHLTANETSLDFGRKLPL